MCLNATDLSIVVIMLSAFQRFSSRLVDSRHPESSARAADDRNWTTLSSRGDFDGLHGHDDAVVTRVLSSRRRRKANAKGTRGKREEEEEDNVEDVETEKRPIIKEGPSQRAGNFGAIIMSGAHTLALTLPSRQAQPLPPPPPRASVAFMQSSGACKKAQGTIHK